VKQRSGPIVGVYLLVVFLSGAVVGVLGHRLYSAKTVTATTESRRHESFRKRYLEDMETRLKLDADQKTKLIQILDEFKGRFDATRRKVDPEMKVILEEQRARIRQMLRPEQQTEYEKMILERDRKQRP
jgi:hypothetical protein